MKILLFLLLALGLSAQRTSKGIVTRVIDGDSYIVEVQSYKGNENTLRIRAVNFDCPEVYFIPKRRAAQPYGDEVKKYMTTYLLNKEVDLTYYGKDSFGRTLAFIKVGDERLDEKVLSNGWGWVFKGYHPKKDYKAGRSLMEKAKKFKQGLWALPNPIEPSEWRKGISDKISFVNDSEIQYAFNTLKVNK